MNEELIADLSEAMKRREKAQAAVARWQEQLNDANEDIQELSARIAGAQVELEQDDEDPEPVYTQTETDPFAPRIFEPVTE